MEDVKIKLSALWVAQMLSSLMWGVCCDFMSREFYRANNSGRSRRYANDS